MATDWPHTYVGKKKRTPQERALKKRQTNGLRMAKPVETRERVRFILAMMKNGSWRGAASVAACAIAWSVSGSRVEQLAAEARRALEVQNG